MANKKEFSISGPVTISVTGIWSVTAGVKAWLTPSPVCKGLYIASSALHGISCLSGVACMICGYTEAQPTPLIISAIGQYSAYCGGLCGRLGDNMNTSPSGAEKLIDARVEQLTRGLR